MQLFIFKTDIENQKKVSRLGSLFRKHPFIANWSVDMEDIDNVLRIESSPELSEGECIRLISAQGVLCEALPD